MDGPGKISAEQETKESKYETFVADVLKDFDTRVQAIQTSAEVNMKSHEAYCYELKRQLEVAQRQCEELREALGSMSPETCDKYVQHEGGGGGDDVNKLFQSMTCLSIQLQSSSPSEKVYQCKLLDGILKGLSFMLVLNQTSWEYTYEPKGGCNQQKHVPPNFVNSFVFPDYMLSRFLTNLLSATYGKLPTHDH